MASSEQQEHDKAEFFTKWLSATMTPIGKPTWVRGKRMAEYHAAPGANGSTFLHDTPAQMKHEAMQPPDINYAFALGDAVHIAVLEPDRFDKERGVEEFFQYSPTKGLDSKAAREAFEADPSKPLVTPELISKARYMRDAILRHRLAKKLLSAKADTELSGFAWDPDAQIIRKIRIDYRPQKGNYLVDIKTCEGVAEHKFWGSVKKYKYGAKAAFYLDTEAMIENRLPKPLFYLIAVEGPKAQSAGVHDAPYLARVFEIGTPVQELSLIEEGRAFYQNRLAMFANAARTNDWEGFEHEDAVMLTTFPPKRQFQAIEKDEGEDVPDGR